MSESLIYQLVHAGRLKSYRIGVRGRGRILIDEADLRNFVGSCRVADPPPADAGDEHLTFLK